MATSANFGNMFSMAGASLLLPFLPLLPKQILLTNLLTDLPEMTIATDSVDAEMLVRPRRWDIGFIRSFMLAFGVAELGLRLPDLRRAALCSVPTPSSSAPAGSWNRCSPPRSWSSWSALAIPSSEADQANVCSSPPWA